MPKTLVEAKISGRSDRRRLAASKVPYWRAIDPDSHLGYRKGKRGGVWVARRRVGLSYKQETIGTADDEVEVGTLDFNAALRAARDWVERERRQDQAAAAGPALTVRAAAEAYIAQRNSRVSARAGKDKTSDTSLRLRRYLLGRPARGRKQEIPPAALAEVLLHELSEQHLLEWCAGHPADLKRVTRRRLKTDLKAALNAAFVTHRKQLPATFEVVVKHGLRSSDLVEIDDDDQVARDNQILPDAVIVRLLQAAQEVDDETGFDGDLYRLVVCLAATGARFSQVVRMLVMDVQPDACRVMVPRSFKGKGGKTSRTAVRVGSDVIAALEPAVRGRPAGAALFERSLFERVAGTIQWREVGRGPWEYPAQLTRPWALIKAKAGMPDVIPYAFRHSSIVRSLAANLPIRLVAALHDTSVAMIERHYARYIVDGLDELAARAVIPLIAQAA